mmetsp:Transcript_55038/g.131161  ORF Transcript_55038/g.131161 Transcript_55038/m.131161 type:complete len:638 (+) Transcript_55038:16-1929(+)
MSQTPGPSLSRSSPMTAGAGQCWWRPWTRVRRATSRHVVAASPRCFAIAVLSAAAVACLVDFGAVGPGGRRHTGGGDSNDALPTGFSYWDAGRDNTNQPLRQLRRRVAQARPERKLRQTAESTETAAPPVGRSRSQARGDDTYASDSSAFYEQQEMLNEAAEVGDVKLAKELYAKVLPLAPEQKRRMVENTVLKAFANDGDYDGATAWFDKMIQEGIMPNEKGIGKLLEAAANFGSAEEAEKVLQLALSTFPDNERKAIFWNMLVNVHANQGRWQEAEEVVERMQAEGVQPGLQTFNTLMKAHAKANRHGEVMRLLEEVQRSKLTPDDVTFAVVLDSLGRTGQGKRATQLLRDLWEAGMPINNYHVGSTLNALAKEAAVRPDNRWQALDLIEKMKTLLDLEPNTVTYSALVNAFAAAGDVDGAKDQLRKMEALGMETGVACSHITKALLDQGRSQETETWLEEMGSMNVEPDARVYDRLLTGFARRGLARQATRLMRSMRRSKVQPDRVAHYKVLQAHAKANDFIGAFDWLASMPRMQVNPDVDAYTSIVAELARSTRLRRHVRADMAKKLLQNMASNRVWLDSPSSRAFRKAFQSNDEFQEAVKDAGVKVSLAQPHDEMGLDRYVAESWTGPVMRD